MLILKEEHNKFIVKLDTTIATRLQLMSDFFTEGKIDVMLSDIIKEGLEVTESIHKLHTDKEYQRETIKKYCTTKKPLDMKG